MSVQFGSDDPINREAPKAGTDDTASMSEFLSNDDSFAYAFAAYAFSWRPPLIDDFVGHKFIDVTRHFPAVVRADIRSIDRARPENRAGTAPCV